MEYADPLDAPHLMKRWIGDFNAALSEVRQPTEAIGAFARAHLGFVRIHPFFDGNGRVARLISNIPVLRAGHPPITIPLEQRGEYIDILWEYENAVGKIRRDDSLVPPHPAIERFTALLRTEWQRTLTLVEEARRREAERQVNTLKTPS